MPERSWLAPTLRHLLRLTDDCGIIQHAKFWVPNYVSGYCVDDNSRALIVACRHHRLFGDAISHELMVRYLAFIIYVRRDDGQMRNFIDYGRNYLEDVGSSDSLGRTIWGLGHLATVDERSLAVPAREIFHHALPHLAPDNAPHTLAYGILGLCAYGERKELREEAGRLAQPLVDGLLAHYHRAHGAGWDWFLPILTYDNARLPQALLHAGLLLEQQELIAVGLRTLAFLNEICYRNTVLNVVGSNGWYPCDGECALFDQQPIDAGCLSEANLTAYQITREPQYLHASLRAMDWFHGANIHGMPLYHAYSGGCCDGLNAEGVNANQGAESTVALLMAQLALFSALPRLFQKEAPLPMTK